MAKMTLLELVQDILNDADCDHVNSINDTVESLQAAQIVKTCYFEMIANRNWPHLRRTIGLDDVLDTDRPTHLKLPTGIKEIVFINYNKKMVKDGKTLYSKLAYVEPEDFLSRTNKRNSLEAQIEQVEEFGGIIFQIRNDKQPEYFTSFDDEYIVCDSFQNELETTLHSDQVQMVAYQDPIWINDDSAIPDLPSEAFPALLEESKSTAFVVLKQQPNQKAEQKSKRQQRWLSRKAWRVSGGVKYPDYGRKSRGVSARSSTLIDKDGTLNVI
jgi:hypothetical protein